MTKASTHSHTSPSAGASADESWFAEQFAAAAHAMWCIAIAITRNRTHADDVVQESATIALTKLSEFTPGTNFNAWLGKIVRFVALNHARRSQRIGSASIDPIVLDLQPDNRAASEHAVITGRGELRSDQDSFDDRLTGALSTLDETARACLLLRTVLNLPYREIAAALDLPEGTAMSHVHRARQSLRELLTDTTDSSQGNGTSE